MAIDTDDDRQNGSDLPDVRAVGAVPREAKETSRVRAFAFARATGCPSSRGAA